MTIQDESQIDSGDHDADEILGRIDERIADVRRQHLPRGQWPADFWKSLQISPFWTCPMTSVLFAADHTHSSCPP